MVFKAMGLVALLYEMGEYNYKRLDIPFSIVRFGIFKRVSLMNQERDRFLTEARGECWHEWKGRFSKDSSVWFYQCEKCNYEEIESHLNINGWNNNFSTWEGFGKLLLWCKNQVWWYIFMDKINEAKPIEPLKMKVRYINPDIFADAVCEFLKDKR